MLAAAASSLRIPWVLATCVMYKVERRLEAQMKWRRHDVERSSVRLVKLRGARPSSPSRTMTTSVSISQDGLPHVQSHSLPASPTSRTIRNESHYNVQTATCRGRHGNRHARVPRGMGEGATKRRVLEGAHKVCVRHSACRVRPARSGDWQPPGPCNSCCSWCVLTVSGGGSLCMR